MLSKGNADNSQNRLRPWLYTRPGIKACFRRQAGFQSKSFNAEGEAACRPHPLHCVREKGTTPNAIKLTKSRLLCRLAVSLRTPTKPTMLGFFRHRHPTTSRISGLT